MTNCIDQTTLTFNSRSANEGFARSAAACYAAQLDPTLDEIADIKTAVSPSHLSRQPSARLPGLQAPLLCPHSPIYPETS